MFSRKLKIAMTAVSLLLTVTLMGCSPDTQALHPMSTVTAAPNVTNSTQAPIKSTAREIDFKAYTAVTFEGYDGSGFVHI